MRSWQRVCGDKIDGWPLSLAGARWRGVQTPATSRTLWQLKTYVRIPDDLGRLAHGKYATPRQTLPKPLAAKQLQSGYFRVQLNAAPLKPAWPRWAVFWLTHFRVQLNAAPLKLA